VGLRWWPTSIVRCCPWSSVESSPDVTPWGTRPSNAPLGRSVSLVIGVVEHVAELHSLTRTDRIGPFGPMTMGTLWGTATEDQSGSHLAATYTTSRDRPGLSSCLVGKATGRACGRRSEILAGHPARVHVAALLGQLTCDSL
jgi:hypothetical protein